jgi:NitT/TauT family transport system ATP-binding protein
MSPRPGSIDRVVTVDLPRPRADKTRALPRFFELVTEVRRSLREDPGLAGELTRPDASGSTAGSR